MTFATVLTTSFFLHCYVVSMEELYRRTAPSHPRPSFLGDEPDVTLVVRLFKGCKAVLPDTENTYNAYFEEHPIPRLAATLSLYGGGGLGREEVSSDLFFTMISEYFRDSITSGNAPSIQECHQFLEKHPRQQDAKQVRDKVRNLIGCRTSKRTVLPVELAHPQEKLMSPDIKINRTNITVLQRGRETVCY